MWNYGQERLGFFCLTYVEPKHQSDEQTRQMKMNFSA